MTSLDCPHESSYKYQRLVRTHVSIIRSAVEKLVHDAIGLTLDKLDYRKTHYDNFYLLFCPACRMLQMSFSVAGGARLKAPICRHKTPYSFSCLPTGEVWTKIKEPLRKIFHEFNVERTDNFWKIRYNTFAILYCEPDQLLQIYLLDREPKEVTADMQRAIVEARAKKEWAGIFEP